MKTKEKLQRFWAKHKYTICTIGGLLALIGLLEYAANKAAKDEEIEEIDKKPVETASDEDTLMEDMRNDESRKLACGGWVLENDMDNKELPMMIANDVPISALGEFGKELIKEAEQHDLGRFNQDLEKAWTSIIINLETADAQPKEKEETTDEQSTAA